MTIHLKGVGSDMSYSIKRAAVIGSGVMGSAIAAHLANVGISTIMLDIVPENLTDEEKAKGLTLKDHRVRNRMAIQNKQALKNQKPSPITSKESLQLIEVGNLEDDLDKLTNVDWIIEVVVEKLAVKKELLAKVEHYHREGTIISSNTSGISIEKMTQGLSKNFRKHFIGTHFFNPPRYMKLLEIIPTQETKKEVISFMKEFGENVLGKGVVEAKDTPNFIANRIGTYGLLTTVQEMLKNNYRIGEVDSVTGPMIGRPKSATFRTLDVVGLDTVINVANNIYEHVCEEEKKAYEIPDFMLEMQKRGWLGSKSGQGFYLKKKEQTGSVIYELNPQTMAYEERRKLSSPAIETASQLKGPEKKIKALISDENDRAGKLVWTITKKVLLYSAQQLDEVADHIVAIDQAMRWGFGWELGPFELWDVIGVKHSVERMKVEGEDIPDWVIDFIDAGNETFYKSKSRELYYYDQGEYVRIKSHPKIIDLNNIKNTKGIIKKNSGASLIDLGDGVACLEFNSPNNALGFDIMQMVNESIEIVNEQYTGLVIGNQGKNFSVGANLALMLMEAQDENYFELEMVIRMFQQMTMNIKYSEKPIVVAPFQMTLGGGAEVCLPASAIQASTETYIGLVEFGVGLIPGGGGTKELYLKQLRNMPKGISVNLIDIASDVFEKVAMAKVSTSAAEARELGYLNNLDGISVHPDHLIYDAKQKVLSLANNGYKPPQREQIPVVGEPGYASMLLGAKMLHTGGYATDHDLKIAEKLAYVLSGGRIQEGTFIDEQVMLDLEREAFLSLIGEQLTQARMQHMLIKGKPLRN